MMTPANLRELEMSLAFEQATGLIEGMCDVIEPAGGDENGWYDLKTAEVDLGDEAEYLDSRRLLQHHPEHPSWVILRDEDEPLPETEGMVQ